MKTTASPQSTRRHSGGHIGLALLIVMILAATALAWLEFTPGWASVSVAVPDQAQSQEAATSLQSLARA